MNAKPEFKTNYNVFNCLSLNWNSDCEVPQSFPGTGEAERTGYTCVTGVEVS